MRKLDTTGIVEPVKAPITKRTLEHWNEMAKEPLMAIVRSLVDYTTNDVIVLYGCVVTDNIPGTSSVTAGAVYYNGEIFLVDANASLLTTGLQTLVWVADEEVDPATFSDGDPYDFHVTSKMKLQVGLSGSGLSNWDASTVKYIEDFIPKTDGLVKVRTKKILMGNWDMDASDSISVAHGLDASKIISVQGSLVNDAGTTYYPWTQRGEAGMESSGVQNWDSTNIVLYRTVSGVGGSTNFNSTAFDQTPYNRGVLYVTYEA